MSTLKVNTIQDTTGNDALTIDSSGNVTASQGFVPSTQLSHRNLIINGDMQVAQRGTSFTSNGYTLDRFSTYASAGTLARTVTQSSTAPSGFSSSIKIVATTAEADFTGTEYAIIRQTIEAQNLQQLDYGTSTAKSVTLSFWVRSNVTGNYAIIMYQDDASKIIGSTYTISSADTWEQKTITFVGNTADVIANDSGSGLRLDWSLAAGSDRTTTDNTSWGANATGKAAYGHTAQWGEATNDDFYITGVQLEVGSVATPFEHRSYGEELARCQRYYFKPDHPSNDLQLYAIAGTSFNVASRWHYNYPTTMRSDPTVSATFNNAIATGSNSGKDSTRFYCQASGGTPYITPGTIIFDAEL